MNAPQRWLIGCACWLLASACAAPNPSDGEGGSDAGQTTATAPESPLHIESGGGCSIDADCASGRYCFQGQCGAECVQHTDCGTAERCSPRGRCVHSPDSDQTHEPSSEATAPDADAGVPALAEYESRVTVSALSETVMMVQRGQGVATLSLQLNGNPLPTSIAYTLERDDAELQDSAVRRAIPKERVVEIPIPTGLADPSMDGSRVVNVVVVTSLGAFNVALEPSPPVAGTYAGHAHLDVFGETGLPIAFELLTEPNGATLDEAEQAWLVLPAAGDNLFSPIEAFDGAPKAVAAKLEYDDFTRRWVARTEYEYRLEDTGALSAGARPLVRALRFELEPRSTGLVGSFSDRWEGLYDARSARGVREFVDVLFEGTLELWRVAAPSSGEPPAPLAMELPVPALLPAPPTTLCKIAEFFPQEPQGEGEVCLDITNRLEFERAPAETQAACALASATGALRGRTTGAALAAFLDDQAGGEDGDGEAQSFADFMKDCADGTDGTCVPSDDVLCARQLLAHAVRNQTLDDDLTEQLVTRYQQVTGEAYLGRQLAAFKRDSDTRLRWLQTTDYPAIVTSAVEDLVEGLLDDWQRGVLDAHLSVLGGYFDPSGLSVLSRSTTGDARDSRRGLLGQVVQGWRGAMDALVVATDRWHELYRDADQRASKAQLVRSRLLDLYLMAGVLTNLSRDAGVGYQASAFGAGFSELMRAVGKLGQPFDALVFARDGEVVVSTSLDAQQDGDTLLQHLHTDATNAIAKAADSVQSVVGQAQEEALNETQLANRMGNEINVLREELVDLCGLPVGCSARDFRSDPACSVRVAVGECGFAIARADGEYLQLSTGEQSVSEAGRRLLSTLDAAQGLKIASEEVRSHTAQLELELVTLEALAANIVEWNERRLRGLDELGQSLADEAAWRERGLQNLRTALAKKADERSKRIAVMRSEFEKWNQIRVGGVQSDLAKQIAALTLRGTASVARDAVEIARDLAKAQAEALPKAVGTSTDPSGPGRLVAWLTSAKVSAGFRIAARAAELGAAALDQSVEVQRAMREANLAELKERATLDDAISDDELREIDATLQTQNATSAASVAQLRDAYALAKAQRESELAYARDMAELQRRRTAYLTMMEDHAGLLLREQRAELGLEQQRGEYLAVVQRAELLDARLQDLQAQRADVNQLVGSPAAVFARANRLAQAENRLQAAKEALMNWLIALEYHAVQPFVDQRLQILLAQNPYQLEEIAAKMDDLEQRCGGPVNRASAVLSLRDELLNITLPQRDAVTTKKLSPTQRFRAQLEQGHVPIDKRVRYRSDATVGELLSSDTPVLATSFALDLNDFANLAATCNAKVGSIAVQLVGDIGAARPTVTILYDGTSRLRSCQPAISKTVELLGPGKSAFDEITLLRVPGRSISPLASVNRWLDDAQSGANVSLAGLPLASQYTVLIDTELGENSKLDWSRLEDILLEVEYVYSDVFAQDQCR